MKKTALIGFMLLVSMTLGLPGEASARIDKEYGDCNHLTLIQEYSPGKTICFDANSIKQHWGKVEYTNCNRIVIGPGCVGGTTCGPDIEVTKYDYADPSKKARYQFKQGWCWLEAGKAEVVKISGFDMDCRVWSPPTKGGGFERGGVIKCRFPR